MPVKVDAIGDLSEMFGTPTVDSLTAWHFLAQLWDRATTVGRPVAPSVPIGTAKGPEMSAEPINYFRGFARSMIEQSRERANARNPYWVSTE